MLGDVEIGRLSQQGSGSSAAPKKADGPLPSLTAEELFEALDKDKSGEVTKDELVGAAYVGRLGPGMTPEVAARLFETLDADGSGALTLAEFRRAAVEEEEEDDAGGGGVTSFMSSGLSGIVSMGSGVTDMARRATAVGDL